MPSTEEGSPTPPGSRIGSILDDGAFWDEKPMYALPKGMLSSNASCAVTSASASVVGGDCTPSRGQQYQAYNASSFNLPTPQTTHHFKKRTSLGPIERLEADCESHYQVQYNLRLQKFLVQFPGGAPDHEIERFKQKEAIERTKFVCWKNDQVANYVRDFGARSRNHLDPFVASPSAPQATAAVQGKGLHRLASFVAPPFVAHKSTQNPFQVSQSFPPPPSAAQTRSINSFNQNGSAAASASAYAMSSSNSVPPDSSQSSAAVADGGAVQQPSEVGVTHATTNTDNEVTNSDEKVDCFTKEQLLLAFQETWKRIDQVAAENKTLKDEVKELKQMMAKLTHRSDANQLVDRLALLENKAMTGMPLDSDASFVANLHSEVKLLGEKRKAVSIAQMESVPRRALDTELELARMTVNNKLALMEKYLGIDITTTGPKPHDVLENLHSRIWVLEEFLDKAHPNSRAEQTYQSLANFGKTVIDKNNAMVLYSATPGFTNGGFNNENGSAYGSPQASGAGNVAAPRRMSGLQSHLATMRFDPSDVRHPSYPGTSPITGSMSGTATPFTPTTGTGGAFVQSPETQQRRMSGTPLLPSGHIGPDYSVKSPGRGRGGTFSNMPYMKRGGMSLNNPDKPVRDRRNPAYQHARSVSASTNKSFTPTKDPNEETMEEAIAGAAATQGVVQPPKAPKSAKMDRDADEKAYRGWMNQKPGEFIGKTFQSLAGLGQKD